QRDPHLLEISEEEQLVADDWAAQTAAEMVYRGARLVPAGVGVGKEIGCVQPRSVPQFIEIAMKLVGAGFGDVVDLRCSVTALVNRVGGRVDGDLLNGVQPQHKIG